MPTLRPLLTLPPALLLCLAAVWAQPQTYEQHWQEGNRLHSRGQYDPALQAFAAALQTANTDQQRAQALLATAKIHLARENLDEALQCYRGVYALKELSPVYRQMVLRQIASLQRRLDDPDAARQTYELLLAELTAPDDRLPVLFALVDLETEAGLERQAIARLQKALTQFKDNAYLVEAYQRLTRLHAQLGDLKAATATAREGWRRFPERLDLMWTLIRAYEEAGQETEAAATLEEVLLHQPDTPEGFELLYALRSRQDKLPDLVRWLEKQARADALGVIWLEYLALLWEWEHDAEASLRVRQLIVARRPTDAGVLTAAGHAALRAQRWDLAGNWFEQALGVNPGDETLIEALGEVHLRRGQPEQALSLWKRGLQYRPGDPHTTRRLAGMLTRHMLYQQAAAVYLDSRAATGQPALFAHELGALYEALADTPAAVREYLQALQAPANRLQPERLYRLAEDGTTRSALISTLTAAAAATPLPFDAVAVLGYARALAGEELDQALEPLFSPREPDNPARDGLLTRLASRLEQNERPRAAVQCYQRLLAGRPTSDHTANLTLRLSALHGQLGDWPQALKTLQALDLKALSPPLTAAVALEIGDLLLRARQPADAIGAFELALQRGPHSHTVLRARWGQADGLFALGDHDQALAAYDELLGHESDEQAEPAPMLPDGTLRSSRPLPGPDYVAYQRAEALFRQGRPEADDAFRRFAAQDPAGSRANNALERVLLLQQMKGDAPAGATYRVALLAAERGDATRAAQLLTALTSTTLGDEALLLLARLQLDHGDRSAAVATLDRLAQAFAQSPLAPRALYLAAMSQSHDNRPETLRRLEALVTTYPEASITEEAKIALKAWTTPQ